MANTLTTTSNFSSAKVDRWFAKRLLEIGEQDIVAEMFAQKEELPRGQGAPVVSFLRYDKLNLQPGTLTEGTAPAAVSLGINRIAATASDYGELIAASDKLIRETNHAVEPVMVDLLGEAMAKRREQLTYDGLLGNTNILYSGTGNTARSSLASGDVMDSEDVLRAISELETGTNTRGRAPRFKSGPAAGMYAAIIHPNVMLDLRQDATFNNSLVQQDIEELRGNRMLRSKVFDWEGVRFFVSNFMPEFTDSGDVTAAARADGLDDITVGTAATGGALSDDTYYWVVVAKHRSRLFPEFISDEGNSVLTGGGSAQTLTFEDNATALTDYVHDIYIGTTAGSTTLQLSDQDLTSAVSFTASIDTTTAAVPVQPAGVKVYPTWFFGEGAYGAVDVATSILDAGFVPKGRSFSDPLAQLVKASWKMSYVSLILDDLKIVRVESASDFET